MAYKEIILDDSIFDLDWWLPQNAVEELAQAILYQDKLGLVLQIHRQGEYFTENSQSDLSVNKVNYRDYENMAGESNYKIGVKGLVA